MNNNAKWAALGGLGAAIGSTACCILPLVLFSLGISGAWIGTLTSLNQYQPWFVAVALLCFAWLSLALIVLALAFPLLAPLFLT